MCWVGTSASRTNRATSQVVVWIIPIPAADGRQNKQSQTTPWNPHGFFTHCLLPSSPLILLVSPYYAQWACCCACVMLMMSFAWGIYVCKGLVVSGQVYWACCWWPTVLSITKDGTSGFQTKEPEGILDPFEMDHNIKPRLSTWKASLKMLHE